MMDTLECIGRRHGYPGRYTDERVPKEDLRRILEAGLQAPSGCNKETTSLLAVDDPILLEKMKTLIDPPVAESGPAFICVLAKRLIAYRNRCFATQDYAAAIENILLAVTALGYASSRYEGYITDEDRILGSKKGK